MNRLTALAIIAWSLSAPLAAQAQTYDLYWNAPDYGIFSGTFNPTSGFADVFDPVINQTFIQVGLIRDSGGVEEFELSGEPGSGQYGDYGNILYYDVVGDKITDGAYYAFTPGDYAGRGVPCCGTVTPLPASAPEINSSSGITALTLLFGGIAVLKRGRRRSSAITAS
jgi:hypothetical protein